MSNKITVKEAFGNELYERFEQFVEQLDGTWDKDDATRPAEFGGSFKLSFSNQNRALLSYFNDHGFSVKIASVDPASDMELDALVQYVDQYQQWVEDCFDFEAKLIEALRKRKGIGKDENAIEDVGGSADPGIGEVSSHMLAKSRLVRDDLRMSVSTRIDAVPCVTVTFDARTNLMMLGADKIAQAGDQFINNVLANFAK
jgi:hypothetical protein